MTDPAEGYIQRLCQHEGDKELILLMDKMEADGIPKSQWSEKIKTSLDPAQQARFSAWLLAHRQLNAARPDKVRRRILTLQADNFEDLNQLAFYFARNKGEETYTGFIVALSLVDQSVWVVFNALDSDGRWTTAHESPDDWDDDRDDVPDYLPDLDPAWAELAVPGEKWAAAKVADSLRSWNLGDAGTALNFSHPLSLMSAVVPELVPVAMRDLGLPSTKT
ncbi:MAG: hypothetical protein M1826_005286 [Phylliscum demangeonii]|nr:MAG: hypothetical protein M1826_005286 [Phylliscum demangeonii]